MDPFRRNLYVCVFSVLSECFYGLHNFLQIMEGKIQRKDSLSICMYVCVCVCVYYKYIYIYIYNHNIKHRKITPLLYIYELDIFMSLKLLYSSSTKMPSLKLEGYKAIFITDAPVSQLN